MPISESIPNELVSMEPTENATSSRSQRFSKCRLLYSLLVLLGHTRHVYTLHKVDSIQYEEGKRQFEVVQKYGMLPRYGLCWTDTMKALLSGCKQLTDVEQSHLALSYLNCFLLVQGRKHYACDPSEDIKVCTKSMTDADSASYATFFTHTQNICYFLESQVWHENTEKTISLLSSSSEAVVDQLEKSSYLQQEVIQQQKISLQNQNLILDQASNLSSIINTSSNNIHNMFTEFQQSTSEQRQLINDIFDRVSQLQSIVLGEFSWFYSFVYYVLSIVMCYILTSTQRTNGARFWLFCLMTLNAVGENLFINFVTKESRMFIILMGASSNQSENVYRFQWICRKVSASVGMVLLIYFAVKFRDMDFINYKLLNEIKNQNEELRMCFKGKQKKLQKASNKTSASVEELKFDCPCPETYTTGYESGSQESSGEEEFSDIDPRPNHSHTHSSKSGSSTSTDPSYKQPPGDTDDDDSVSSFSTALTGRSEVTQVSTRSSRRSCSLQRELRDLHNSTPFKDLSANLLNWATCGHYRDIQATSTDKTTCQASDGGNRTILQHTYGSTAPHKYLLRQRKPPCIQGNPVLQSESPRSFSTKVKHLEKTSARNSRLIRNKIIFEGKLAVSSEEEK